jgi:hypothetical protein
MFFSLYQKSIERHLFAINHKQLKVYELVVEEKWLSIVAIIDGAI